MTSPFVSLYILRYKLKSKKEYRTVIHFYRKKMSVKRIRLFFSLGSFVDDNVVKADLTVFNLMNHN